MKNNITKVVCIYITAGPLCKLDAPHFFSSDTHQNKIREITSYINNAPEVIFEPTSFFSFLSFICTKWIDCFLPMWKHIIDNKLLIKMIATKEDNQANYFILLRVFFTPAITWWFLPGGWVAANLLKSPGLFSVFWPIMIMLLLV